MKEQSALNAFDGEAWLRRLPRSRVEEELAWFSPEEVGRADEVRIRLGVGEPFEEVVEDLDLRLGNRVVPRTSLDALYARVKSPIDVRTKRDISGVYDDQLR